MQRDGRTGIFHIMSGFFFHSSSFFLPYMVCFDHVLFENNEYFPSLSSWSFQPWHSCILPHSPHHAHYPIFFVTGHFNNCHTLWLANPMATMCHFKCGLWIWKYSLHHPKHNKFCDSLTLLTNYNTCIFSVGYKLLLPMINTCHTSSLVFEGPVQSGFFPIWVQTRTAISCIHNLQKTKPDHRKQVSSSGAAMHLT